MRRQSRQILEEVKKDSVKDYYKKVLMMQEEEKRRVSRDLHDETGQIVVALGASLSVIENELKLGNVEKALGLIAENRKLIQEIASKMKATARNLRPPALDILGLSAVLREYFSLCTQSNPVKIEFNENLKDIKLAEDIEITLYRIVQEAIYNILIHSGAKTVKVKLVVGEGTMRLDIEDDGRGFSVEEYESQPNPAKMGLRGIKERVDILNGAFYVDSGPGKGTRLTIVLPLEESGYGNRSNAG